MFNKFICLFFIYFALFFSSHAQESKEREAALRVVIGTQGKSKEALAKLGSDAIPLLIKEVESKGEGDNWPALIALTEVASYLQLAPDLQVKVAETVKKVIVNSNSSESRSLGLNCLVLVEKEQATSTLLAYINDSNEQVRTLSIALTGIHGDVRSRGALARFRDEWLNKVPKEKIQNDSTYRATEKALFMLDSRAQGMTSDEASLAAEDRAVKEAQDRAKSFEQSEPVPAVQNDVDAKANATLPVKITERANHNSYWLLVFGGVLFAMATLVWFKRRN